MLDCLFQDVGNFSFDWSIFILIALGMYVSGSNRITLVGKSLTILYYTQIAKFW